MKLHHSPRSVSTHIEPLEARIAPAVIVTGVPNVSGDSPDTDYNEQPFVNIKTAIGDPIADAVRAATPGDVDTYYLRLSGGDTLRIFTTRFDDAVHVNSGNVIAFFADFDGDKEVDEGELVSLSLGKNVSIDLSRGLAGSIIANLDEGGTASTADDRLDMDGLVSGTQGIKSIFVGTGDIAGSVIAGGSISKISMPTGRVGSVLTGSAANGVAFDFFPGLAGGEGTIAFTPDAGVKGGSITNVLVNGVGVGDVQGRIEAGAGGAGAAGGSLDSIRIVNDSNGFTLKAGAGGNAAGSAKGGIGGSVTSVFVPGVADATDNDLIQIAAGNGGNSDSGTGGRGGSISGVLIGYQTGGKNPFESVNLVRDNLRIDAGDGGSGKVGGVGGSVLRSDFLTSAPNLENSDEIIINAGDGGASSGVKAGVGGSLNNLSVRNVIDVDGPSAVLQAGAGGTATGSAIGAAGGAIKDVDLLVSSVKVLAGNGSSGRIGGVGGALNDIVLEIGRGVISHSAIFNAGTGGNGTDGNGGNGGAINLLNVRDGDFATLEINSGTAANGGNSTGGKAGNGGAVNKLQLTDNDYGGGAFVGNMLLRSGVGGDGTNGGGNGGAIRSVLFASEDLGSNVQAGAGGDAVTTGKGGVGGGLFSAQFVSEGVLDADTPVSAVIRTGNGGDGKGATGAGGAGGDYRTVNVRVPGSASLVAGSGGGSAQAAAGKGGSLLSVGATALDGSGEMIAGNGGETGEKPGKGGDVRGTAGNLTGLYASESLTIKSGNGTNGGAGGTIRFVGYGSSSPTLTPAPTGNITIQAGNGSANGSIAGAGGSIISVSGSVTSAPNTLTSVIAGAGAGSAQKASAGGSIVDVTIQRGGSPTSITDQPLAELRILAGDAGDSTGVAIGAKGGDVRNVRIQDISRADDPATFETDPADTVVRSIAAGNGGDASGRGGQGGTIDNVRVPNHDIGVRSGAAYGYATMGGLFAGTAGSGGTAGKAGSVTNVTASAIAAIVAGRGAAPELVERVSGIYLSTERGSGLPATDLLEVEPLSGQASDLNLNEDPAAPADPTDPDGVNDAGYYAFRAQAYATNNLVGAVVNPTRVDANQFAFIDANGNKTYDLGEVPIDGLVAAKVFDQAKVNFTPEARIVDGTFYDYDNRNA